VPSKVTCREFPLAPTPRQSAHFKSVIKTFDFLVWRLVEALAGAELHTCLHSAHIRRRSIANILKGNAMSLVPDIVQGVHGIDNRGEWIRIR
jgi:hypothetical protein